MTTDLPLELDTTLVHYTVRKGERESVVRERERVSVVRERVVRCPLRDSPVRAPVNSRTMWCGSTSVSALVVRNGVAARAGPCGDIAGRLAVLVFSK